MMKMIRRKPVCLVVAAALGACLLGPVPAHRVRAAERSPQGDIPDVQVFVTFRSTAGGYELQVPQGWGRTARGSDVRFTNALEGVEVAVKPAAAAPTAVSARTSEVAALEKSGRSVRVTNIRDVRLPGGPAVLVQYTSTSAADGVTGKSVRLESDAYLFFNRGAVAILTVWAPLGADNVDQWQRIARSFRWL